MKLRKERRTVKNKRLAEETKDLCREKVCPSCETNQSSTSKNSTIKNQIFFSQRFQKSIMNSPSSNSSTVKDDELQVKDDEGSSNMMKSRREGASRNRNKTF